MVADYYKDGLIDTIDPVLLQESLSAEKMAELARIDGSFIGGEALDDFLENEVEVFRIIADSDEKCSTSYRLRPNDDGMVTLRIVDEDGGEIPLENDTFSDIPTLGELADFFEKEFSETGGLLLDQIVGSIVMGSTPEDMKDFFLYRSYAYPGLQEHAERFVENWFQAGAQIPKTAKAMFVASDGNIEKDGLQTVISQIWEKGRKRLKVRTLFGMAGYKKRSEQNVKKITTMLLGKGIVSIPTLLQDENGKWGYDFDKMVVLQSAGVDRVQSPETSRLLRSIRSDIPFSEERLDEILEWGREDSDDPEPCVLLYLLSRSRNLTTNTLKYAQEAVNRAPESGAPWLCIGEYVATAGYDTPVALQSFYNAERYADSVYESAYVLAWIRKIQSDRHYVRQAEKKLTVLESARLDWLPDSDTPLVDVLYPRSFSIKGLE